MKVLVTGGAGYVGSSTARHLLSTGHAVVVLDNLSKGHVAAIPSNVLVRGDVADRALVGRLLAEHSIEAVIHFAGVIDVGESVRDPGLYYESNVATPLSLLQAMREHNVCRFVFSSSAATYGAPPVVPIVEDSPLEPRNPYGYTKLVVERMLRDFSHAYGLGHVILRYFNASGASSDGAHGEDHRPESHLIPIALSTLLGQRETLEIYGNDYPTPDGTCVRDYVHVEDLARAHELALRGCPDPGDATPGRIFNVGTGRGHSVREVIRSVERVTGKQVPYRIADRREGDPPRLIASADRLRHELEWRPEHTEIDDIVSSAWTWHREHPDGYAD